MAGGLYTTFCEVTGRVHWSMMYHMSSGNILSPGKLLLLKLSTNFYMQCILESGKKSEVVKLEPGSITDVQCRNGNFNCYIRVLHDRISFSLTAAKYESSLQYFVECLTTLKNGHTPVSQTSKGGVIAKPRTQQIPKVQKTKNSPALNNIKNTVNQTKKMTVQKFPQQSKQQLSTPASRPVSQTSKGGVIVKPRTQLIPKVQKTKNSPTLNNIKNTVNQTKKMTVQKSPQQSKQQLSTPASRPSALQKPRSNIKKTALEKKEYKRKSIITEDDFDKENNGSTGFQSPNKDQSPSSDRWCSFGSSRKKSPSISKIVPLEKDWQSTLCSPKRPAAKVKSFYGHSASKSSINMLPSIHKKRRPKKSILDTSNSNNSPKPSPSILSYSLSQSEVTSKGFLNLGNTCYMNASLQSLLRLVPFVQELANREILKKVKRSSLYRCMYNLHCCKDDANSLKKESALKTLKNAIASSEMTKKFSGHLQNDAHEFINICLDQMKEEVQVALKGKDLKQDEDDIQAKVCPIVRNLEGFLRKYIVCTGCKDLVTKDELFNHLSLNSPVSSGSVPVRCGMESLLETFFKMEKVERKCEKCECNDAIQSFQIQALPRVLILHVNRSEYRKSLGTQEKNSDSIKIFRFLDLGRFCNSDTKGPTPFSLRQNDSPSPLLNQDNETPSNDQDDFVTSKSRRRLDMSVAKDTSYDSRLSTGDHSSDLEMNSCDETPRISSDVPSLNSRRLYGLSDKEQLELATEESLKSKELEDELNEALAISYSDIIDASDVSPYSTGSARKRTSSKNDQNICARDESDKEDEPLIVDDSVATPTKRRKVEDDESSALGGEDNFSDLILFPSGDDDLERALELSRKDATLGLDEQLQVDEAIKRSLQDESLDAELLNLSEIAKEELSVLPTREACAIPEEEPSMLPTRDQVCAIPEEEPSMPPTRDQEKDIPSHQYKLASIVRHIGTTTSSGHYISDVLDIMSRQWTRYDDLSAEKVSEFAVRYRKESDGYIYFYLHNDRAEVNVKEQLSHLSEFSESGVVYRTRSCADEITKPIG